jgi:hypothetical protein
MTRKEAQDILFDIGKTIAEKQGLTEIETEEPWDGFWTGLYDSLKRQYGEDFKTVIFHDGKENPIGSGRNKYVEIGYRFSDPRLSVFGRTIEGYQTLASIEIGDTVYDDETGKYVHSGEYTFRESQVWRHEGFEMLETLLRMWKERGGE